MKHLLALCFSVVALTAANPASNMKLAFSDEFDGPALDASKWATIGEPTALSFAKAGKSGALRISLIKKEDMIQTNGISSRGKFEQTRGYFEAAIRMNGYRGHGGTMSLRGKDDKVVPFITVYWEGTGGDYLTPWARFVDDKGQHDLRAEGSGKTAEDWAHAWAAAENTATDSPATNSTTPPETANSIARARANSTSSNHSKLCKISSSKTHST
jgi:hypothetical protein